VFSDSSLWFEDFPAVRHADDESTWRVDDEGVFSPTSFDVLFVAQLADGLVIAYMGGRGRGGFVFSARGLRRCPAQIEQRVPLLVAHVAPGTISTGISRLPSIGGRPN